MIFNKSKFLANTSIFYIKYKYSKIQNNDLFYFFNNLFAYVLDNNFSNLKIMKHNVYKFLTNLLIKLVIKKLLYCNINKFMKYYLLYHRKY